VLIFKQVQEKEGDMFIAQSELFKNLGMGALEAVRGLGEEKTYDSGEVVFREGDGAEKFYILGEGSIDLMMGDEEELCFVVNRPGEVFGWSALVEPYCYRASARSTTRSRLLEIRREVIEKVVRDYPADGAAIFRNLAAIVTEKLREAYQQRVVDMDLEGIVSATNEGLDRTG
jgi:CRP-like cAMP-binding protein